MHASGIDVHDARDTPAHEVAKRVRVVGGEPDILVEVEAPARAEIERLFAMQPAEFGVDGLHRAAGGQAQNHAGFRLQSMHHQPCRETSSLLGALSRHDVHGEA